jgi:hypothetical protein
MDNRSECVVDRLIGRKRDSDVGGQESQIRALAITLEILALDATLQLREFILGARIVDEGRIIVLHTALSPCVWLGGR